MYGSVTECLIPPKNLILKLSNPNMSNPKISIECTN